MQKSTNFCKQTQNLFNFKKICKFWNFVKKMHWEQCVIDIDLQATPQHIVTQTWI
jgi:hypothetical protein